MFGELIITSTAPSGPCRRRASPALADHRVERERQHRADLVRRVRRERVDDAVDRLLGVVRVQVEKTRWPVSAACMASSIDSRSRISPTRMMSGPAAARAGGPRGACGCRLPSWRWSIEHFLSV
jgi:hypothetical protein